MALKWSTVDEIRLLKWVAQFKPAGIHKHFHMRCILERMNNPDEYPVTLLQNTEPKKIFTAQEVWEKLLEYYDLEEADKVENMTLDNTEDQNEGVALERRLQEQEEFSLPWSEYSELMLRNAKEPGTDGPGEEVSVLDRSDHSYGEADGGSTNAGSTGGVKNTTRKRATRRLTRRTRSQPGAGIDDEGMESVGNGDIGAQEAQGDQTRSDREGQLSESEKEEAVEEEDEELEGLVADEGEQPNTKKPRTRSQIGDIPPAEAATPIVGSPSSPATRTRKKAPNPPVRRRLRNRK
ncbi:HBR467Cp [Eremothecium sinecaudum]|uniref:Chromatin modification-related protein EAF7 n=1 Tax=Eremothecium sinecaudum TaxID=45286 RepID=A0A109UXI6_9SACH|nr:HBR467Cp [Eremothecium sinecaudum]AMD19368.1 HBR467Cp [Eremothecium sinecaudum]